MSSSIDVDYAALESIATVTLNAALAGLFVGAGLTFARGRPASVAPTYMLNTCMNFALVGGTFETARSFVAKSRGRDDVLTTAMAGAVTGGGMMAAYRGGRAAAASGAAVGFAVSAATRALVDASEGASATDGETAEFSFPAWSPLQIVKDETDEGELRARMDAAMRGELSAEDEARTRDDFMRWKMRRAGGR